MGRYLLTRLAFALVLVFVVSSAALLLIRIAPGDFASGQGIDLSIQERERLRESLGLNQSLTTQYLSWLGGALRFDFGRSLLYSRPVSALVSERALNTAVLAISALLIATLIGIPLGIYSGTTPGIGRSIVRALSPVGGSVPPLIGSLAWVFLAARPGGFPVGSVRVGWLPTPLRFVVVNGPSASGKSTLADLLAPRLPLPLLSKDVIKAAPGDALDIGGQAWTDAV